MPHFDLFSMRIGGISKVTIVQCALSALPLKHIKILRSQTSFLPVMKYISILRAQYIGKRVALCRPLAFIMSGALLALVWS